jgi:hypothetical protein
MSNDNPRWKGPYGHRLRLRLIVPAGGVSDEAVARSGCERVGVAADGRIIVEWPYRSMQRGNDETALIQAGMMLICGRPPLRNWEAELGGGLSAEESSPRHCHAAVAVTVAGCGS